MSFYIRDPSVSFQCEGVGGGDPVANVGGPNGLVIPI